MKADRARAAGEPPEAERQHRDCDVHEALALFGEQRGRTERRPDTRAPGRTEQKPKRELPAEAAGGEAAKALLGPVADRAATRCEIISCPLGRMKEALSRSLAANAAPESGGTGDADCIARRCSDARPVGTKIVSVYDEAITLKCGLTTAASRFRVDAAPNWRSVGPD